MAFTSADETSSALILFLPVLSFRKSEKNYLRTIFGKPKPSGPLYQKNK